MNKNLNKLEIVYSEIESFKKTYPFFYLDLIKIIVQYTDNFLLENGFSLKIRNLFRMILEDDCDKIKINSKDYKILKNEINKLMFDHLYCYYDFVDLVKRYIRSGYKGFGYSKFVRLLLGEPPLSVYNEDPGLSQAFLVSKLVIEVAEKDDGIKSQIVDNMNIVLRKVYPESCFNIDKN